MVKGFDASNHQGNINFAAMHREGMRWCGIKATEGVDWTDPWWSKARLTEARDAHILVMPYHYLRFRSDRRGSAEAKHFLRVVTAAGWKAGRDLPLSVDLEWDNNTANLERMGPDKAHEYASSFCRAVHDATGRGCVSYLSPGFSHLIGGPPVYGGTAWVADIDAPDGKPQTPPGFKQSRVLFHQTSWKGRVGGEDPLDLDLFLGDTAALAEFVEGRSRLPAPDPRPPDLAFPKYPGKPLTLGSQGGAVREWQAKMKRRGWTIKVDSAYGAQSRAVCMAFQQEKGLVVDGVVGEKTWATTWSAAITHPPADDVAHHPELRPAVSVVVNTVLRHYPELRITSTTGGTHASGSYHYLGRAADLAFPYAAGHIDEANAYMDRAARWVTRNIGWRLAEGIHQNGLSVKDGHEVGSSYWGASTWANHRNHLHLAA